MNYLKSKSRWLATGLALAFLAGLTNSPAAEQEKKGKTKEQPDKPTARPAKPTTQPTARPDRPTTSPDSPTAHIDSPTTQPDKPTTQPTARPDKSATSPDSPTARPARLTPPPDKQTTQPTTRPDGPKTSRDKMKPEALGTRPPPVKSPPAVTLETKPTANGGYIKTTPSMQRREVMEKKPDGEHTQHFAPTGRLQSQEVRKQDGTVHRTEYDLGNKVRREEVVKQDGTKAITTHEMGRDGNPRRQQTFNQDNRGREVSKTVIVQNTTIVKNTTIINNTVERRYTRGHYGYVYRPAYVSHPLVFVSWYDPYWYTPASVVIVHPFHYSWGWEDYGWYRSYHGYYWVTYDVYPAPSYWVTDWLVAGYVADRYDASISAAQAHEEARLAHIEAEQARQAAEKAKDQAEIAEAKAAQAQAELRAKNAEDGAARAEREEARAGKPNSNATPIDEKTKESLRYQIEQTIAEKKEFAEQSAKGGDPILPDVTKALENPNHIYPVSKSLSVVSAKDSGPAGTITEGDLLKLEPGQENLLKDAHENTLVTMRVMTSKGEEGEVTAGTLISVALKDLQDFDSEFRAKLDLGLAEAEKNQSQFKKGDL